MNHVRVLVWSTLVTLASMLPVGHGGALGATSDEEAVRNTVNAYAETWNRHDIDALANLFTPDAEFRRPSPTVSTALTSASFTRMSPSRTSNGFSWETPLS